MRGHELRGNILILLLRCCRTCMWMRRGAAGAHYTNTAQSHPSPAGVWLTPTRAAAAYRRNLSLSLSHAALPTYMWALCSSMTVPNTDGYTSTVSNFFQSITYEMRVCLEILLSGWRLLCVTADDSLIQAANRKPTGGRWTSWMQQEWVRGRWELSRTNVWSDLEFGFKVKLQSQ